MAIATRSRTRVDGSADRVADHQPARTAPKATARPEPARRLDHRRPALADASAWFNRVEVARGRAYNRPLERLGRIRLALGAAVLVAFVAGQAAPRLLDSLSLRSWIFELAAVVVALHLSSLVYGPWFDAHRALFYDKRWGLSTQTPRGLAGDQVKQLAVVIATSLVLVVPLYAVIRATDAWWLPGWLVVASLTVVASFVFPVVIAPVFNRFRPLRDDRLTGRLLAVAEGAGLDVDRVVVADASRRSRVGNAYVTGLGRTRRIVLFDTILDWPPALVEQVVAHELGHWKHAHLRRRLLVVVISELLVVAGAWAVLRWEPLLSLAGVETVGDPASLPLLAVVLLLALAGTGALSSSLSRADERQADLFALEALGRPDRLIELLRRLARRNKADLDPSRWKRLTSSHPPITERMAMAEAWAQDRARRVPRDG